ncbi:MBL fold metallo-hydrolase RNA specificity domain-containing protein [Elioraea tepidiphila]|jgi:metallo-beta-lactamase family protein|uniref:MBL fold metallo-hydrolase RNA specificity domain-containing protein n=1 Tax=Elioraea tepidiphila TaxID=457934 RepID=UPI00035C23C8|nr:MBL fold metallo-hydrolase [Elioraea tepidiphila]
MDPAITFHGAAGTVTGSCLLIEAGGARLLVDCGLFQGPKTVKALNWRPFPFEPRAIDAVVLTHAHIDHSGLIPRLVKEGFRGPVHATVATVDLCRFMLPDSGFIQETEVERLNRRNAARGQAAVTPIYTRADAEAALGRFRGVAYDRWLDLPGAMRARFWNAGHLLGSASVELVLPGGAHLLVSGDIGPGSKQFVADAEAPHDPDWLVLESTYGDRERDDPTPVERRAMLRTEVEAALKAGGNLLIPAFAVERTQELLHDLDLLMERGELPSVPVVIDSPLAAEATRTFRQHLEELPEETEPAETFLSGPNIRVTASVEESKKLNAVAGGIIILSASGMADAGRIRHHLLNNLWRPQATVLFVGYQAPGTLGRLLVDGATEVSIMGQEVAVRARIRRLDVYSGHADRQGLLDWVAARGSVKRGVFLVHGEPEARESLAGSLRERGLAVMLPEMDASYALPAHGAARARGAAARLSPEAAQARFDWHNERAALLLELRRRVEQAGDDAARAALLRRVREALRG